MPRFQIKGGPWTNHEDVMVEIGVRKYGKNAWDRVASLVPRKSSAQCKARWNEWLDPSINKGEWSKGEEAKLLELAQIWPGQWRTIAEQMAGRTATMCDEHLKVLLHGESKEGEEDKGPQQPNLRDATLMHEARPAKTDAKHLDAYEREMIDDARGRLSNTQGKKGLRRERTRQLQETKLLTGLLKAREMREAGIDSKVPALFKSKLKGVIEQRIPQLFSASTLEELSEDEDLFGEEAGLLDQQHAIVGVDLETVLNVPSKHRRAKEGGKGTEVNAVEEEPLIIPEIKMKFQLSEPKAPATPWSTVKPPLPDPHMAEFFASLPAPSGKRGFKLEVLGISKKDQNHSGETEETKKHKQKIEDKKRRQHEQWVHSCQVLPGLHEQSVKSIAELQPALLLIQQEVEKEMPSHIPPTVFSAVQQHIAEECTKGADKEQKEQRKEELNSCGTNRLSLFNPLFYDGCPWLEAGMKRCRGDGEVFPGLPSANEWNVVKRQLGNMHQFLSTLEEDNEALERELEGGQDSYLRQHQSFEEKLLRNVVAQREAEIALIMYQEQQKKEEVAIEKRLKDAKTEVSQLTDTYMKLIPLK